MPWCSPRAAARAQQSTVQSLVCRAPEIFLGQDTYTEALDMWAADCIPENLGQHDLLLKHGNAMSGLQGA